MTTNKTTSNTSKGNQGFAGKSKEEVRELASKGGSSHGTSHKTTASDDRRKTASPARSHNSKDDNYEDNNREHGKQGFASMPHDQVVEIARKGGQHSHDNTNSEK